MLQTKKNMTKNKKLRMKTVKKMQKKKKHEIMSGLPEQLE